MKNPIANLAEAPKMFTEISHAIDKWLWFVEAHSQAPK
jgi:hypothetical protein